MSDVGARGWVIHKLGHRGGQKTLTTKVTESTKKTMEGAGLDSILSCGEGTGSCSLTTGDVYACAARMQGANGYSPPPKPVRAGPLYPLSSLRVLRVLRGKGFSGYCLMNSAR